MKRKEPKPQQTAKPEPADTEIDKDLRQELIAELNKKNGGGLLMYRSTHDLLAETFQQRTGTPANIARHVQYGELKNQFNKTAPPKWGRNLLISLVASPIAAFTGGSIIADNADSVEGVIAGVFAMLGILAAGTTIPLVQSTKRTIQNANVGKTVRQKALEHNAKKNNALPPPRT